MDNLTYSIQQVSNMTGLSKQVIRKWEDRYGIIQPERLDNGYRVYTIEEVQILQKVIDLTAEGHSVKKAALMIQNKEVEVSAANEENPITSQFVADLEEAGQALDEGKLMQLLEQAHHLFGIEVLFKEIIAPFLVRVGQLWCDKVWGEYQEAISSQTVRDFLANVRRQYYVPSTAPLVVGSCLPNERHEIPIQLLLIQCMLKGYRTIMLGPAPAPQAIQSAVRLTEPQIVLLSGSTKAIWFDEGQSLRDLDEFASTVPKTKFFVGGFGVKGLLAQLHLQAIEEAHDLERILGEK